MAKRWEVKNVKEYEKFPGSFGGEFWLNGKHEGYVDIWKDGDIGGSYPLEENGDANGITGDEEKEMHEYLKHYLD